MILQVLTFAGQELLFPTPELDAWIARNQELCDLSQFASEPARIYSGRQACRSRFEQNKGLGLPVINWPSPPPPRLNTLYWPTGATRWAMGWFVATDKVVSALLKKTRSGSSVLKGTLGFGDDLDNDTATTVLGLDMWMLPPRPMSVTSTTQDVGDLYLVPLVDERYFWQFTSLGDYEVSTSTSWTTLINRLATQLGVTITVQSNIEAAYLKPDPTDFTRRYDNAALLLDAAAWSVGRRIVRKLDGSVVMQSRSVADTQLEENLDLGEDLLCGGDFSEDGGDLPAGIQVTFRKIREHLLRSNGQLFSYTRFPEVGTPTVPSRLLTIHCAAYANFNDSLTLTNDTALGDLATQIKNDYYGWASKDYDLTIAGISAWNPCGYDDAVLYAFGRTCADKTFALIRDDEGKAVGIRTAEEPLAYTRVQTLPGNTWPEINLCSDSSQQVVEPRQLGKPVNDIGPDEEGDVKLWNEEGEIDPPITIKVLNKGSATLFANKFCWNEGINDAQWYGGCYEQ